MKKIQFCFIGFFLTTLLVSNTFFAYSQKIVVGDASTVKSGSFVSDTTLMKFNNSIVCLESLRSKFFSKPPTKDTIIGTAFLISDSNKCYLVTVRHLLQEDNLKNRNLSNDSVYIKTDRKEKKWLHLTEPTESGKLKPIYFLSAEQYDIAIISLQNDQNKTILSFLLNKGIRAIPVKSIDTLEEHVSNESLLAITYSRIKGLRTSYELKAIGLGRIENWDQAQPSFSINKLIVHQGNNGAPIISGKNDKLIGMIMNAKGMQSNADILQDPYYGTTSASVIKAPYIIECLRQLQKMENHSSKKN